MLKTIRIIKTNGEIQQKERVLNRLENLFRLIPNGEHVITVSKQQKRRSIEQNRLMWLYFVCIEHETGTSKETVHDYYCELFLRKSITINGKNVIVTSGTSKLTTEQFTDFLNKVQADAASEFGISLPNPDDLRWKEFEEQYKQFI